MTHIELFNKAFKYEFNIHLRDVVIKEDVIRYHYYSSLLDSLCTLSLSPTRITHGRKSADGRYHIAGLGRYTLKVLLNDYDKLIINSHIINQTL
jgi:hypothetical protein